MTDTLCHIPVTATFTAYKDGGEPVMTAAEYVDISADAIARFLVEKCGVDAIFGGEAH